MTYIHKGDYTQDRVRPNLLTHYLQQMTTYLGACYPQHSPQKIEQFVKDVIKDRWVAPDVKAVVHRKEGHSESITLPLNTYITDIIKDNNLSPSGSCYTPVAKRESFLRISIKGKMQARSDYKNKYLAYVAQGMKRESNYYHLNQANAKIFNNAIAGGMNISQFILGDKAGFNAITSVGRIGVKQGYSFIERLVNGNIYLPSTQDAITYILNHARHVHPDFEALLTTPGLAIPDLDEVVDYIVLNTRHYVTHPDVDLIRTVLKGLTDTQRAFVYYAGCLSHLFRRNETMMRSWINSCFLPRVIDPHLYQDVYPSELKSFKDNVISAVLSTRYWCLGKRPDKDDQWNSLKDAAVHNPQGLKEFIYCCRHFVTHYEKMVPVLRPIFQIQTTFSKLTFQHRMARQTVPLSDTDSNIFSNQELIRWKRGKIDFSDESYEMNALITYTLTECLTHVFAMLSAGLGVDQKDIFMIEMKNEFLYPVVIMTAMSKHYMAIATMQEGNLLPHPRKDIKGVNLRSSANPKVINEGFVQFITDFFQHIIDHGTIKATQLLDHVALLEQMIHNSIQNHDSDYLQTMSVKREEEYADASISQYFYYEFWQEVFAPDYGDMIIPNKCYKIYLKGGKKLFKDPVFLAKLQAEHPGVYDRLLNFTTRPTARDRDISYILIPPFKGRVQSLFVEIMDTRALISQVLSAYYHTLESLGIGSVNKEYDALICDFYDPSTLLIA